MVFLVNQGDTDCPHVCIAHVSCFQSLLRSLYYLWLSGESLLVTDSIFINNTITTREGVALYLAGKLILVMLPSPKALSSTIQLRTATVGLLVLRKIVI